MRNIFDQYNQPENKLTHSLVSCLNEDNQLLNSFLKSFNPNFFDKNSKLLLEQQTIPGEFRSLEEYKSNSSTHIYKYAPKRITKK